MMDFDTSVPNVSKQKTNEALNAILAAIEH